MGDKKRIVARPDEGAARKRGRPPSDQPREQVWFRANPEEVERWKREGAALGIGLGTWIRIACNEKARRAAEGAEERPIESIPTTTGAE